MAVGAVGGSARQRPRAHRHPTAYCFQHDALTCARRAGGPRLPPVLRKEGEVEAPRCHTTALPTAVWARSAARPAGHRCCARRRGRNALAATGFFAIVAGTWL